MFFVFLTSMKFFFGTGHISGIINFKVDANYCTVLKLDVEKSVQFLTTFMERNYRYFVLN